jgi:hypothetical protein
MPRLADLASLIRSKNAGPYQLTFDIMFDDPDKFERVRASRVLSPALFAEIYRVDEGKVVYTEYDQAIALKFTIPRPVVAGDVDDTDVTGGQQWSPLSDVEIP